MIIDVYNSFMRDIDCYLLIIDINNYKQDITNVYHNVRDYKSQREKFTSTN